MTVTAPSVIRLAPGERVIAVVPEYAAGPGWANAPAWVHIVTHDGMLRTECIQPDDRTARLHALYAVGAAMHHALIDAVPTKTSRPPSRKDRP